MAPDVTIPPNYRDKENIPETLKNTHTACNITKVFPSLSDTIDFISDMKGSHDHKPHLQVLVCGSQYLVGGVMNCIGCTLETMLH